MGVGVAAAMTSLITKSGGGDRCHCRLWLNIAEQAAGPVTVEKVRFAFVAVLLFPRLPLLSCFVEFHSVE